MGSRGVISLVFDDGYQSVLDDVVPVLDMRQMPGVFAIPLTDQVTIDGQPIASYKAWRNISGRHEIAAHSVTHCNLTQLSPGNLERELSHAAEALGASTLVYPGGAHTDDVVAQAMQYYKAARTVQSGFESLPPTDPMRLKTFNYSKRNWSLLKANLRVVWAWLTNAWLIETYHLVTDEPTAYEHAISLLDFQRHIAFIKRFPVSVRTIESVVSGQ